MIQGRSFEIWLTCQALKTYLVHKRELLFFICVEKEQAATDLSCVVKGRVSQEALWGVQGCGVMLCHLPCSRVCAWGAAEWGAECFSKTLSTLTTDTLEKQMKSLLFVTAYRTRSWLLCSSMLLFSRHHFKNLLCSAVCASLCYHLTLVSKLEHYFCSFWIWIVLHELISCCLHRGLNVSTLIPLQIAFSSL